MLQLGGNSEIAFAEKDSIQAVPIVYAEWNYNNIERPYIVTTTTNGNVDAAGALLNASYWTSTTAPAGTSAPGLGLYSTTDTSPNAILLNTGASTTATFTSANIATNNSAANQYYKLVFYVKANQPVVSTTANAIPSSDIIGSGLQVYSPAKAATVTAFVNVTYPSNSTIQSINNGVLSVDGYGSFNVGDYVLVKNEALSQQNGIYQVTAVGSTSSPWLLTRISDINLQVGTAIYVNNGSTNAGTFWVQTTVGTSVVNNYSGVITIGTDAVIWQKSSSFFDTSYANTPSDNRVPTYYTYSSSYSGVYSDNYPTIITGYQSGTNVYYRIIPINFDGSHPPKDLDGLDINNIVVQNATLGQDHGAVVTWSNNNNCIAYNIYRGSSPYNLMFVATVPPSSTGRNFYVDNYLFPPNNIEAFPVQSTNIKIIPTVNMFFGNSPVEYNNYYVKVYSDPFSDADINRGSVAVDGVNYQKVEVYFGSSQPFTNFNVNLDILSVYSNAGVYIYRPEVYATDAWNFANSQYYPVEELFNANRPGEALLNPFLQSNDRQINSLILSSLTQKVKPISFTAFNPDSLYGSIFPYKQEYDSILNNVIRYYVSDTSGIPDGTASAQVYAKYNNYMSINKVVLKGSNAFSDLTQSSGQVTLLTSAGPVVINFAPTSAGGIGTFDASGLLVLYYNGSTWQTTYPSQPYNYPPKLTNSGLLQNYIQNVNGLILTLQNVGPGSPYIGADTMPTRVQLIEMSPRLEIDLSDNVTSIEVDTTLDNATSANGFPIGYINSNTAKININNIPVYKNNFPHTMWEPFSNSAATFSNLVRQNVKFTGALQSLTGDFTDIIPLFSMYSNDWQVNDLTSITVDVYDYAKAIMMVARAPDYFGYNESMFFTITNIFDSIGFSDYDYDGLKAIMNRRATQTTSFWCDRSNDIYDAIRGFFVAHQIGAYFDAYGIMRFEDLDSIIAKYFDDIPANFVLTDIPYPFVNANGASINYAPNIVGTTLQTTVNPKIGQISLSYQTPIRAYTDFFNSLQNSTKQDQPYTLWSESGESGVMYAFADKSVKYNDTAFWSTPENTNLMDPNTTPKYTLLTQSADAFLQGELINWAGMEYYFIPTLGSNNAPLSPLYQNGFTELVTTPGDVQSYINYFSTQDPRINQIEFNFTGNVLGLSRGQRFTSARNHYLFQSDTYVDGYNNSVDNYWYRYKATSGYGLPSTANLAFNPDKSGILFEQNVAVFSLASNPTVGYNTYPTCLGPIKIAGLNDIGELNVPKSASSFNYFSFSFSAPNFTAIKKSAWSSKNAQQLQVGIHIDTLINGSSKPFILMLQNYENTTKLQSPNYSAYTINTPGGNNVPVDVKNVFDGLEHRLTVVFSSQPNYFATAQPSSTGQMSYQYVTIFIDDVTYGPYRIWYNGSPVSMVPISQFGFACNVTGTGVSNSSGTSRNPYKVNLYEIYACKWFDNNGGGGIYIKPSTNPWHWQCPLFLDGLLGTNPNIEPPYFYWGPNHVVGVKFYDNVQFTTSPAFGNATTFDYSGYDPGTWPATGNTPVLTVATSKSITESTLYSTPFRAKFAVVNSDTEMIALSTANGQVNNGQLAPFQVQGFYNKLTDSVTIEKTIDSSNILNTIQLTTQWIQADYDANQLMNKLAILAHAFNAQMSITMFGNPLVQVGDICQMIFTYKGIGYNADNLSSGAGTSNVNYNQVIPTFFYVSGVTQKWGSTSGDSGAIGLETDLNLIPLIYLPS